MAGRRRARGAARTPCWRATPRDRRPRPCAEPGRRRCRRPGAGRRGGRPPPQDGPDPGPQLRVVERLDDVVVGADLEPPDPIGVGAPAGEDDHRKQGIKTRGDAVGLTDLPQDVEPGGVRQGQVEEQQIGLFVVTHPQRVGRARRRHRVEAVRGEVIAEQLEGRLVVLTDDDGRDLFSIGKHRGLKATAPETLPLFARHLEGGLRPPVPHQPVRRNRPVDGGRLIGAIEKVDIEVEPHPEGVDAAAARDQEARSDALTSEDRETEESAARPTRHRDVASQYDLAREPGEPPTGFHSRHGVPSTRVRCFAP